jgi:ATP-binding cassette, subfamily B, bacterial
MTRNKTDNTLLRLFGNLVQIAKIAYEAAPNIFALIIILEVVSAIVPVLLAWLTKIIFDQLAIAVSVENASTPDLNILLIISIFGLSLAISQLTSRINNYFTEEMSRKVSLLTSQRIYAHIIGLSGLEHFESPKFHDTLRLATQNAQWNPGRVLREASSTFGSFLTMVSFLGIVLLFNPFLLFILLLGVIPTIVVQALLRRRRFDMSQEISPKERKAWYFGHVLSTAYYAKEVRLYNIGNYLLNEYSNVTRDLNEQHRHLNMKELRLSSGVKLLDVLIIAGSYAVIISQAIAQIITIGDVALYIDAVRNIQNSLSRFAYGAIGLSERSLFFSHYKELMRLETSVPTLAPEIEPPPLQNKVEFRNVSFRYTNDTSWVLRDVNFTINKGETMALVGVNGAGKTTIVKLLTRFYDPTEGQILWDGIDIRYFKPDALRERIGAILQDFVHYELTARENIGFGDVSRIDDMNYIKCVAEDVGISDFIEQLPQSYDTILSPWLLDEMEEGTDLSGGQWQKIAISRAYMRQSDVLILDEPTSALDAEAEHDIYQRFTSLMDDRASILISHRFSTVRMADRIAVLENGTITELGTHEDLLRHNSTYARLYHLQKEKY